MQQPENAFEIFSFLSESDLAYIYQGDISSSITESILSLTESNLEKKEKSLVLKKRVYFIMVECLQNITRHQEKTKEQRKGISDFFAVLKQGDKYYTTSGNYVETYKVESLKSKLETINQFDKEGLTKYYKELLTEGYLSEKGGAGLGLIEMARKSGNKLAFRFQPVEEEFNYFYLMTKISIQGMAKDEGDDLEKALEKMVNFHQFIHKKNILFLYHGNFNQENLLMFLHLLDKKIIQDIIIKKKVFSVMIEMLQNIVNHGSSADGDESSNPGVFYIAEDEKNYIVSSGNIVTHEHADTLKSQIDRINASSWEELRAMHSRKLSHLDESGNGIGLIEIKMRYADKLDYSFHRMNEQHSFYAIDAFIGKK